MKCTNCGQEFLIGKFCPSCGTPAPEEAAPNTEAPENTYCPPVTPVMPAKRKKTGVIVAVILALLLVAGAVFAVFAFGGNGPADKIGKSLLKTLDSEIFNFDVTVDVDDGTMNFTGTIEIVPEEYVLNMYMDATYTGADETVTFGIYDGQVFSITENDGEKWYSYSELDEDVLEEFFDSYLENADKKSNTKEDILEILEELDDATGGELSEVMDLEVLTECMIEYANALNDKKWLEENAGFYQEKENGTTYYTYEPDLVDFCEASLAFFEEAFEDDDYYDEAVDALDEIPTELRAIKLEYTVGVKSGYLTYIYLYVGADDADVEMEMSFSDFGKAELDYDELDDLASECEKGYEEQYGDYYD